ncbi:F-box domain-containing protein [Pleurotus pulmonarius]
MNYTGARETEQERSPTSTKNALPVELIHQIIGDLAQADDNAPEILGPCALVCRSWAAICRAHIFRTITISYLSFAPRLSFLYFTAPHLSKHIVEVVIRGESSRRSSYTFPDWTAYCFDLLNNLRSLRFHHVTGEWSQMPTPLVQGITTLLRAPRLRKLHISGQAFGDDTRTLPYLLSLCSGTLQDLVLQNVHMTQPGIETDGLSAINMGALSSLRLECVSHPGLTETRIKCPKLESVVVKTNDMGERYPLWISSGVKELKLIVFPWSGIPKFGNATRISVLTIDMATPTILSEFQGWLEACISGLPHPNLLAELTIRLEYDPWRRRYPELAEYAALSSYLAQLRDRMPLERISATVQMVVHGGMVEETDQVRETAKLRDGFAPILRSGVNIRLVQHQEAPRTGREVLMDCRV